jgi:hypothetical protein
VLATSNDPVRLSFLTVLLADAGITAVVLIRTPVRWKAA